jgi:hypothetical protein
MKRTRSAMLGVLGAAAAILLTACGSDKTVAGSPVPLPIAPSSAETSASAPSSSPAAAPGGNADVTKPGAELKVGERAVVPFKFGTEKEGTIAITVTAIEKGENADLAKYGDKAKDLVPYFIRATIENVGGTDLAYSSVSLRAIGGDGRSTGVIISGDVDKCESESADKNFTTPGAKYETCVLQASRASGTVGGATFDKGDAYSDAPVIWKP